MNYLNILNRFVSTDDNREWMTKPFNANGKTCSTNSYVFMIAPLQEGEFEDQTKRVARVMQFERNQNSVLSVAMIKEHLSKFTTTEGFDEVTEECDACYGTGSVEYEFHYNRKSYGLDHECPICDGDGEITVSRTPNGKREFQSLDYIQIGSGLFDPDFIQELVIIADELGVGTVSVISQVSNSKPIVFSIGELEMLVMPCINNCAPVTIIEI